MPRISEMTPSKYLKKEDCEPAILLTVTAVTQESVGSGEEMEDKWIMHFAETKGMVLNSTNMRLMEMITGSDNSDDWIGKKVVAYNDPNVSFGGKLTGGIRLRAPRSTPKAQGKSLSEKKRGDPHPSEPLPAEADDGSVAAMSDDVPFNSRGRRNHDEL